MAGYTSEQGLKEYVEQLVADRFGPFRTSIDADKVMPYSLYSRDINDDLQAPGLLNELQHVDTTAQIEGLLGRVEGLRTVHDIATSSDRDTQFQELVHGAMLKDEEQHQLEAIIAAYRTAVEKVPGNVKTPEYSDEAVLASITPDMVQAYIGRLYNAGEWLEPTEALVSQERLTELEQQSEHPGAQFFQSMARLFFDENHYAAVIRRCEEIHRPFLADIARLFLYQARLANGALADKNYLTQNSAEISATLDRVDRYGEADFSALKVIGELIPMMSGILRMVLSSSAGLTPADRARQLEIAAAKFERSAETQIRAMAPALYWTRAQMARGFEREQLELGAFQHVNTLLAECALEREAPKRLMAMATLLMQPAVWKLERADYAGCLEAASMAKAMAAAAVRSIRDEMNPALEEMRKAAEDEDADSPLRAQLMGMRTFLSTVTDSVSSIESTMELLSLQARARIAEVHSQFDDAYACYQQAAKLQNELVETARKVVQTVLGSGVVGSPQLGAGFEHEARAIYFQGMAALNKGDKSLMNLDFKEAHSSYQDGKNSFGQAGLLWRREADRLPDPSPQRSKAAQEESSCQDRIRYVDARIEMADGERLSSLDQYWEAAKRFDKAAGIFEELVRSTNVDQSARVAAVFKASEEICSARFLMNASRRTKFDPNAVPEVTALLDKAATRFTQNGEMQWGSYARALRYEYEAFALYEMTRTGARPADPALEQEAQRKIADAAAILRQFGMESRAASLETWSRAAADRTSHVFTAVMLPKPLDLPTVAQGSSLLDQLSAATPEDEAERRTEQSAQRLMTQSITLNKRLSELRDRRDRGRVDDGQYIDLARELDKERLEALVSLQSLLKGRDAAIDEVLHLALTDVDQKSLVMKLADPARSKGLPPRTIELIQRGEGALAQWIVEVSFARVARVAAA